MATFDSGPDPYKLFLELLGQGIPKKVREELTRQPYRIHFQPPGAAVMTVVTDLGDKTFTHSNQS